MVSDLSSNAEPTQHPTAYNHPIASFPYPASSGSHPNTIAKHASATSKHTDTAPKHIQHAINDPRPYIDKAASADTNPSIHPHLFSEHPCSWRWILHHHLQFGHRVAQRLINGTVRKYSLSGATIARHSLSLLMCDTETGHLPCLHYVAICTANSGHLRLT